jgi:hypothetical protein
VLAALTGLALAAIPLLVNVLESRPRLAATNATEVVSAAAESYSPGELRCQSVDFLPRRTRAIALFAGARHGLPGPPLTVSIGEPGAEASIRVRVPGGYPEGRLDVPIPPLRADLDPARICVRNEGRIATGLAKGGNGSPESTIVRVDALGPEASTASLAGTALRQATYVKSSALTPALLAAALAALALAAAALLGLLVREAGREP